MGPFDAIRRWLGRDDPPPVIVREYGRDSMLVWANLLIAPLLARAGRRVGLRSEEEVARLVEADAARLRAEGYLVTKVERFALPVPGGAGAMAAWQRVTYERADAAGAGPDAV